MNKMSSQELHGCSIISTLIYIIFLSEEVVQTSYMKTALQQYQEEQDITKPKHGRQLGSLHPDQFIFCNNWRSSSLLHTFPLASSRSLPGRADTYCCVLLAILGLLLYVSNESSYWTGTQTTNNDRNKRVLEPILGYSEYAQ